MTQWHLNTTADGKSGLAAPVIMPQFDSSTAVPKEIFKNSTFLILGSSAVLLLQQHRMQTHWVLLVSKSVCSSSSACDLVGMTGGVQLGRMRPTSLRRATNYLALSTTLHQPELFATHLPLEPPGGASTPACSSSRRGAQKANQ
jgi:hypothetical protein